MLINPDITADINPDDASLFAMKAAVHELKVAMRKPRASVDYPERCETLAMLTNARTMIDRINAPKP